MLILVAIFTLGFAVLAWRDFKVALTLLAGVLPVYLLRFSIGPIPSTALEALILTAFAVWFVKFRARRIDYRFFGPFVRPLLLLLAASCFAVVVAKDTLGALGIWKAYFVEPAMVFVMMRSVFDDRKDWMNALKALGASAGIVGAFAIFQALTGIGIPSPWDLEHRATSVFDYPNAAGLFLAPVAAIAIVLAVTTPGPSLRQAQGRLLKRMGSTWLPWLVVAILSVGGVIAAQTEAAFVAIPGALLLTLLISNAKRKTKIAACAIAAALLVSSVIASPTVRQKLTLQDYSGQVRLSQWSETRELLRDNIPFGVGLSEYPAALAPYHDPTLYEIFQYPHNIFLNIWVELGLLGLIAFFWLAWLTFHQLRNSTTSPLHNSLHLAAFAALAVMTIHGLVDVPYFKNDLSVMVWILLALMSVPISSPQKNS